MYKRQATLRGTYVVYNNYLAGNCNGSCFTRFGYVRNTATLNTSYATSRASFASATGMQIDQRTTANHYTVTEIGSTSMGTRMPNTNRGYSGIISAHLRYFDGYIDTTSFPGFQLHTFRGDIDVSKWEVITRVYDGSTLVGQSRGRLNFVGSGFLADYQIIYDNNLPSNINQRYYRNNGKRLTFEHEIRSR